MPCFAAQFEDAPLTIAHNPSGGMRVGHCFSSGLDPIWGDYGIVVFADPAEGMTAIISAEIMVVEWMERRLENLRRRP